MIREISKTEFFVHYSLDSYLNKAVTTNHSMLLDLELQILKQMWNYKKPRIAMEIGIRKGFTANFLMQNSNWLKKYIGIDVPPNFITPLQDQQQEVVEDIAKYVEDQKKLELKILPHGSQSLTERDFSHLDFVFIDGDHSKHGVMYDSILALKIISKNGVVFWHDYLNVHDVTEVLVFLQHKFSLDICHIKDTYLCFWDNNTN